MLRPAQCFLRPVRQGFGQGEAGDRRCRAAAVVAPSLAHPPWAGAHADGAAMLTARMLCTHNHTRRLLATPRPRSRLCIRGPCEP
eukprot:356160-Chlamydomonas_euryale.AAC.4